jgi:hypothetical protein
MSNNLSPKGEVWMGIVTVFFGLVQWQRSTRLTWYKGAPVEPWQSKYAALGFLLMGTFLIAHAIVRKLK